ncbi:MAG: ribosome recycling factor [Candidatus Omnitrophota bacterium]|nr:ribosome recycling factor [Candidatus Omnitrophota bacterium]
MTTKDILHDTEDKMKKTLDAVSREFLEVRTGRANPALVEGLHIDYYGAPTMLKQIASISIPDARLIVIQPWDKTALPEIEKAIMRSNLGITPSSSGTLIRLEIPQLSKERREELAKLVKKMAEDGRVSLRTIRRDANEAIKKLQDDKVIPEDERFKAQDAIQKLTDKYIARIEEIVKEKEKELVEF